MITEIDFKVKGEERKKLAYAIGELLGMQVKYTRTPKFDYLIGGCILDKNGVFHTSGDLSESKLELILERFYKGDRIQQLEPPEDVNILVRQSRLTDFIRATVPVRESIRNVMPRKALYMSRHMIGYYAEANMPVGTRLPRCLEYICCEGSCQEHRGIMFLMAIWSGSALPEWWLSKSGQMAQK